jgi:hypothetical protein
MTIGLAPVRDERKADRLHRMLLLPFLGGDHAVNRRGRTKRRRATRDAAEAGPRPQQRSLAQERHAATR